MFSSSSLWNDKDAMLRWISEDVSSSSLVLLNKYVSMNGKGAMLRWISEDVFKFFFMRWQGCNIKMNKWECFQILLYGMTRVQC